MNSILIVEDEKPISDLIRLNLTDAGYRCTCVFDGMAAADLLDVYVNNHVFSPVSFKKIAHSIFLLLRLPIFLLGLKNFCYIYQSKTPICQAPV